MNCVPEPDKSGGRKKLLAEEIERARRGTTALFGIMQAGTTRSKVENRGAGAACAASARAEHCVRAEGFHARRLLHDASKNRICRLR